MNNDNQGAEGAHDPKVNVPQSEAQTSGAVDGEGYQVGYGKPPKHTQFPKGNGPGKGRPKGAKNGQTLFKEAFGAKVTIKIDGRVKKLSKMELAMHQLANKASSGNLKAIDKALELHDRYGPKEDASDPTAEELSVDLVTLQNYIAMYKFGEDPTSEGQGDDGD